MRSRLLDPTYSGRCQEHLQNLYQKKNGNHCEDCMCVIASPSLRPCLEVDMDTQPGIASAAQTAAAAAKTTADLRACSAALDSRQAPRDDAIAGSLEV